MENSYKFFSNKECKYFPCHNGLDDFNCLFCYCPMYSKEKCLGKPEFKEVRGKVIKVCTNCTFPHDPDHYDQIMQYLKENM